MAQAERTNETHVWLCTELFGKAALLHFPKTQADTFLGASKQRTGLHGRSEGRSDTCKP